MSVLISDKDTAIKTLVKSNFWTKITPNLNYISVRMSWTISEILKPFTKLAVVFCLNTLLLNSTKPTLLNSKYFTRNSLTLSNEFLWAPKCQIIYYLLVTNCFVYLYSCTDQDPRYSNLRRIQQAHQRVVTAIHPSLLLISSLLQEMTLGTLLSLIKCSHPWLTLKQ